MFLLSIRLFQLYKLPINMTIGIVSIFMVTLCKLGRDNSSGLSSQKHMPLPLGCCGPGQDTPLDKKRKAGC